MASMLMTPEQQKDQAADNAPSMVGDGGPRYATGEIYLGDDAMEALGLETPLPIGTVVTFTGTARIVSGSAREESDGDTANCMSMQPTELDIQPTKKAINVKAMFPNSKMEA